MTRKIIRDAMMFAVGGAVYGIIEILWRGRTHPSMVLTGGGCFLTLYKIYRRFPKISLPEKCVIGSLVITSAEFVVGCTVNLWLGLGVWDYSSLPFNLLGQVCILYTVLWGFLSIPISYICKIIGEKIEEVNI